MKLNLYNLSLMGMASPYHSGNSVRLDTFLSQLTPFAVR